MRWLHAGWQVAAMLVGLVAGYGGLVRHLDRTRERPPLPGGFDQRWHQALGWVFAVMLAVGYGLGVLTVRRAGGDLLTGPHALVGTMVLLFAAVVALLGTALASRQERKLRRLHRLFGCAVFAVIVIQGVLGLHLLIRQPPG